MATDTDRTWTDVRCALGTCPMEIEHDPKCDHELRRNAERYLWLRGVIGNKVKTKEWRVHSILQPDTPEGFDAAVDAAMSGAPLPRLQMP